jgi:hypothetical protein
MSTQSPEKDGELAFLGGLARTTSRRNFLQWSGITIAVAAVGCSDGTVGPNPSGSVDLGSGDTGVLNYAYALEQLEAAFYTKVVTSFYTGASAGEQTILTDIKNHEVIHRNFLKAALGSAAIADLTVDFTSINFTDRASVLGAAKAFEDLGVSAYNGAGKLIVSPDYLVLAGKIVSVEARHAAAIRDLLQANSFAGSDVVNANGLDQAKAPSEVLAAADVYITTTVTANNLPTS